MKLLELFSGAKSVGKVATTLGYEVISLDLKDADINCDIIDWDYTVYEPGYFDVIWASPPCDTFSTVKNTWVGRHGYTRESIQSDIDNIGLPILRKAEEIIRRKVSVIRFLVICLLISTPLPVALSEDSALVNFKMLSLSTAMKLAKETLKNCQNRLFIEWVYMQTEG